MNSPRSASGRAARPSAYILAALVIGLALSCNSRAFAVVTSANSLQVVYQLAAGTDSPPINPTASVPVVVMGTCYTAVARGIGQVNMQRVPGTVLYWTGLNSTPAGTIAQGISNTPGDDIVQIDSAGLVVLEVNTADGFRVHNGSAGNRQGYVTLIW